jgi:Glutathione-dependent formaldehyde-activating enzyme
MSGQPTAYLKTTADSGNPRVQAFCPRCGAPIYSTTPGDGPQPSYTVRVGILRQRKEFTPRQQNWFRSAQPWVTDLPRSIRMRSRPGRPPPALPRIRPCGSFCAPRRRHCGDHETDLSQLVKALRLESTDAPYNLMIRACRGPSVEWRGIRYMGLKYQP